MAERDGLAQRGVAAVDAVVVEAVGIDHAHTAQQHQSGIAVLWQRPLVTGADLDAGQSARLDDNAAGARSHSPRHGLACSSSATTAPLTWQAMSTQRWTTGPDRGSSENRS